MTPRAQERDVSEQGHAEWEPVADAVLAAVQARVEALVRKASDDFYYDLLGTVQDYLSENAAFNIKSRIESADRQALSDRLALQKEREIGRELLGALRNARECLFTAVQVGCDIPGFDPAEHIAIKRADAAIALAASHP